MASGPIQFSAGESPSIDQLGGGVPTQINAIVDAAGNIRMRPGISAWLGAPTTRVTNGLPIIGISQFNGALVYVEDSPPYRSTYSLRAGLEVALPGLPGGDYLGGTGRPTFAVTRERIVIADGGQVLKWEDTGNGSELLGGSPPNMTHVATIAQRVVGNANDPSGIIYWSDIGNSESWPTGLNFLEAETKQDPVVGLYVSSNEIVALGTESIQMLAPDPSDVFTPARTLEVGTRYPYSYVQVDTGFYAIDHLDRVIKSDGRAFSVVSSPAIGEQLDKANLSGCWGMRAAFFNYDIAIWNMPADGRTFAFDTGTSKWSEWRSSFTYDAASGTYPDADAPFAVTSSFYKADERVTLVGLLDGTIAKLDPDASTDMGRPIVVTLTSTFENRKTSLQKKCNAVRLVFTRGLLSAGASGVLLLSYRDDLGAFCEPFRIDLGDVADSDPVVAIRSLGTYRTRQWRIVVDSVAFKFAFMEEDYAVLDS